MKSPSAILNALPRLEIQKLARREGIKANEKSSIIIKKLLQKYPKGVPRHLVGKSPAIQEGGRTRSVSSVKAEPADEADDGARRNSKRRKLDNGAHLQSVEALDLKPSVERLAKSVTRSTQKEGPGPKDVRYARRELTKLVNEGIHIPGEIEETEAVLEFATGIANEVSKDLREVVWLRFCLETDLLREFKEDRTLWDGTQLMKNGLEKEWKRFLAKIKREEEEKAREQLEQMMRDLEEQEEQVEQESGSQISKAGSQVGHKSPLADDF